MQRIEDRLTQVEHRISEAARDFNRNRADLKLLAVSKQQTADSISEAYALGLTDFGENYLQEALDKQTALEHLDICWHFIGPIQSNKTKAIANHFNWIHSVDRLKVAQRINAQRESNAPVNVCIQVNIDEEEGKAGVAISELHDLAQAIIKLPKLCLRGLMVIPRPNTSFEEQKLAFRKTRQLLLELNKAFNMQLDTLSMGMSADLEAAIAEGATIVRIGSAIFGARSAKPDKPNTSGIAL